MGQEVELGAEALGLGTVGLVRVIPIVIFALLGGILANTRDRHQLLIWVQSMVFFMGGPQLGELQAG